MGESDHGLVWALCQPDDHRHKRDRDIGRPEWPRDKGARHGNFPAHLNEAGSPTAQKARSPRARADIIIGIVRKHRTDSGLIRYDQRRDSEWPQAAREIITAEKPQFVA